MRSALILFALALVAAIGAYAVLGGTPEDEDPPEVAVAATIGQEPASPEKQERVTAQPRPLAERRAIRQIAPETIAAPAASEVALVREDPRPPLGNLGFARDKPLFDQNVQKGPLLRAPLAISAGRIVVRGYRIRLAGVIPTPLDKICIRTDGTEDPCGMRARTAFRQFLRGRAIRCDVPAKPTGEEIVTTCALFKADLGAWLVENGWALPDGDRYQAVAAKARDRRRGFLAEAAAKGR